MKTPKDDRKKGVENGSAGFANIDSTGTYLEDCVGVGDYGLFDEDSVDTMVVGGEYYGKRDGVRTVRSENFSAVKVHAVAGEDAISAIEELIRTLHSPKLSQLDDDVRDIINDAIVKLREEMATKRRSPVLIGALQQIMYSLAGSALYAEVPTMVQGIIQLFKQG